ncbi:hypothetical protein [Nitrosomonas sp.]|uniref:hypothetical protein n=1 Tax=Nitrosomonas sp. TaxID=42353 RepID=UPI0025F50817|nr:hypothetical protein [Nitrosomonas sp.]
MKEWFIALVSIASAALGALLAFLFTSRAKRDESILRFKEEKYAKLLVKLQGFVAMFNDIDSNLTVNGSVGRLQEI